MKKNKRFQPEKTVRKEKSIKKGNQQSKAQYKNSNGPKKIERVQIESLGLDEIAKGIVRHESTIVKVNGLLNDEKAIVEMTKKGRYYDGKLISIVKSSPDRVKPKCKYFNECGGCQLQHMSNKAQAKFKEEMVRKLMRPYGKTEPIIAMENPYEYRNKIHSTFGSPKKGEIISGIYKEYSHEIIPIDKCIVQDPKADAIILTLRALAKSFKMRAYDEDRKQGFLRHVLIRTGFKTGQVMVVLVVADKIFPSKNNFVKALLKEHPEITTIVLNINNKSTSKVLGDKEFTLYGKGFIEDELCGFRFKLSSKSFYQVNPIQTEKLYNKAIEMAKLDKNEIVLDAYSGIGTIGLLASKHVKEVIGIELNKDAVKNAKDNTIKNNVQNANFYQGDAGDFMVEMAAEKKRIDTVFMDPTRTGSDEKFLGSVVKLAPKKVVYISCNPVTQETDLKYLVKNGYKVEKIQPLDMFPQTLHVECIVLLTR